VAVQLRPAAAAVVVVAAAVVVVGLSSVKMAGSVQQPEPVTEAVEVPDREGGLRD
jgi:hypothetical protein